MNSTSSLDFFEGNLSMGSVKEAKSIHSNPQVCLDGCPHCGPQSACAGHVHSGVGRHLVPGLGIAHHCESGAVAAAMASCTEGGEYNSPPPFVSPYPIGTARS
jgi:hypothetical protein